MAKTNKDVTLPEGLSPSLTLREASALLHVHTNTLRRWHNRGILPGTALDRGGTGGSAGKILPASWKSSILVGKRLRGRRAHRQLHRDPVQFLRADTLTAKLQPLSGVGFSWPSRIMANLGATISIMLARQAPVASELCG